MKLGGVSLGALVLGLAAGTPAWTQSLNDQSATSLDEIIVIAQRREQNLQEVPLAVTAVSGEQLTTSGIRNLRDLSTLVPGLQVTESNSTTDAYLRGIGSQILSPGAEKPIAVYVDDVYYAWSGSNPANFLNVSQIAVLRGPQGTLFGRNATGGLMQVLTRTPGQAFEFETELGYGNQESSSARVYLAGGIADRIAADLSLQASRMGDGYGVNLATGDRVGVVDHNVAVRSKWVFEPTDKTSLTLIGDYYDTEGSPRVQRMQEGTVNAYGGDHWDTRVSFEQENETNGGGVSLNLRHEAGFATITNIASYRENELFSHSDPDQDIVNPPATWVNTEAIFNIDEKTFTEELRLSSPVGGPLQWQAGVFYFNNESSFDPQVLVIGPMRATAYPTQKTESVSPYGQAEWAFRDDSHLTLGLRYTSEDRELDAVSDFPFPAVYAQDESFSNTTYRVALDHRFTPSTMGYVSVSTGFKSGGFNAIQPAMPAYKPEEIDAYAVGLKSDIGKNIRFNAEAFYYDYTDLQVDVNMNGLPAVLNGGDVESYGLEAEVTAQITASFSLAGGLALMESELSNTPGTINIATEDGGGPLTQGTVDGNKAPFTSDVSLSLSANYVVPIFGGNAHFNGTYYYNSGYPLMLDNVIEQDAYSLLNLSVRWSPANDRYSVKLWGSNLTDEAVVRWAQVGTPVATTTDRHGVAYGAPRTYGVTLGYEF